MNIDQITADTTDEQILDGVRYTKAALATALADDRYTDSESLAKMVNGIAEAEGRAYVFGSIRDLRIRFGDDRDVIVRHLTSAVLLPAIGQDTWSGRANDARRAYLDGVKDAVSRYVRGF
jgi:hypothetical protein